uniref:Uncharacterized protein n=1 Tax=Anguilla anguilla TaxID=7936 RepID=A0A0E9TTI2_ANGAN
MGKHSFTKTGVMEDVSFIFMPVQGWSTDYSDMAPEKNSRKRE